MASPTPHHGEDCSSLVPVIDEESDPKVSAQEEQQRDGKCTILYK